MNSSPVTHYSLPSAFAQVSLEDVRREQQEIVDELRRTEQSYKEYLKGPGWRMSYGAWVSSAFTGSDNDDRDATTQDLFDHSWVNDLRFYLYGRNGPGTSKVYARIGTQFTRNTRSSAVIMRTDWIQPTVEMLYVEKSIGSKSIKHTLTAGRQYVQVKDAIALAVVADGLAYELKTRRQKYGAFVLHQLPGENNIDFLAPRPGRSKRWFYGMQYSWNYHPSNGVSFFAVGNLDDNTNRPDESGQRHEYNSNYLGAGLSGTVLAGLKYELQYIMEMGKTYSDSSAANPAPDAKVDIDAQAVHFGLDYFFAGNLGLVIGADYYYGSGDADAVGNVFSSDGGSGSLAGSGSGGKDNRFIAFGGKNLGYAFAPTLTNLRIIKTGFSIKPFGWSENRLWEDFKVMPHIYFYTRDKASGATSDPYMVRGAGASKNVGHEIDFTVSWRLMSDVKYSLKYGRFYPGSAFVTKSTETYLRLNVSLDL